MKELPVHGVVSCKELLALPVRDWKEVSTYDHLYLVPTGEAHDSGYGIIAIVGVRHEGPVEFGEVAAYCDDIGWLTERSASFGGMRMDCLFPAGILRMWGGYRYRFEVGVSLSSTDVKMVAKAAS